MFVIYEHPLDFPGHFVVRRWLGGDPTQDFAIADSLEAARAKVPQGMYRMPHCPGEDDVIVETWI
jgi:hypothetical protein